MGETQYKINYIVVFPPSIYRLNLLLATAERNSFYKEFLTYEIDYDKRKHRKQRRRALERIIEVAFHHIVYGLLHRKLQGPQALFIDKIHKRTRIVVVAAYETEYELRYKRGLGKRKNYREKYLPEIHSGYSRRLDYLAAYTVEIRPQKENRACTCKQSRHNERQN